jgi:hypothetical protein
MDKKSKILIAVFIVIILVSVALTYWRTMVKKDYVIENQIDCDPYTEACFIWKCDPASIVEGEKCTGDPEADIWYYKIARRIAANIPLCDPNTDETCDPWTCADGEKDCSETLCDEMTGAKQGVECNNPEQYTLENPIEEEECDPETDEECVIQDETPCAEGDAACAAENEDSGSGTEETTE